MRAHFEKRSLAADRYFAVRRAGEAELAFEWHHHDEVELTLVLAGRGRRFVGDHIGAFAAGDLVLLGPNLAHAWCPIPTPGEPAAAIVVQFGLDLLGLGALDGPRLAGLRGLLARAERGLQFSSATRDEIAGRLVDLDRHSALRQLGELLVVLDRLAEAEDARALSTRGAGGRGARPAVQPVDTVRAFVAEQPGARVSLDEAAALVAMSPSAFSRYFRRTTGQTFTTYLNEVRIARACALLVETDRGIAQIADEAGFPNLSHFNRQFLRVKGLRPSEYRRAAALRQAAAPAPGAPGGGETPPRLGTSRGQNSIGKRRNAIWSRSGGG
jgi:AraC-like DNA-binding protein